MKGIYNVAGENHVKRSYNVATINMWNEHNLNNGCEPLLLPKAASNTHKFVLQEGNYMNQWLAALKNTYPDSYYYLKKFIMWNLTSERVYNYMWEPGFR